MVLSARHTLLTTCYASAPLQVALCMLLLLHHPLACSPATTRTLPPSKNLADTTAMRICQVLCPGTPITTNPVRAAPQLSTLSVSLTVSLALSLCWSIPEAIV
jgi:hypothetical protein